MEPFKGYSLPCLLSPPSDGSEARSGLSGLVNRVAQVAGETAATTAANILTAPFRVLIDVTQAMVAAVQAVVDAANNVLSTIDTASC